MSTLDVILRRAIGNPDRTRQLLEACDAEKKLIDYIRLMWHIVEPPDRDFVEGRALHALCEHLEAVKLGQIKKLIVNIPPGCTKSLTFNVFFPSWIWGPCNMPGKRFIGASYAAPLSIRDNRKCRNIITSELYQSLWGDRFELTGDQNEKVKFENDKTGWRLATSVGGVGTGERADIWTIDDPHNVKEAESDTVREETLKWFAEVVTTRKNDIDTAILIIMQRVHERDVAGFAIMSDLGYELLCLPMEYEKNHKTISHTSLDFKDWREEENELLWTERFPPEEVEELKKGLRSWGGDYAVAAQLQQRPAPRGGGLFKRGTKEDPDRNINFVDTLPEVKQRARGWDLAATKDGHGAFTVGLKMSELKDGRFCIEDVFRDRLDPEGVESSLKSTAKQDGVGCCQDLPQDPGQAGKHQVKVITKLLAGYTTYFSPESGDKVDRARPFAAQWNAGNVCMVRAPWNDALISELTNFPSSYKDQVDAASRAFMRITIGMRESDGIGMAPILVTANEF